MLAQVTSAALRGIESYLVGVEVNLAPGVPAFSVVGLPQGAVRESRDRVWAALANAGIRLPPRKITVNLAPADVKKEGSAFDLPIAVGLLTGTGHIPPERLEGVAFVGELGLDGALHPVRGALAIAARCREERVRELILPGANAPEAAVVEGVHVRGAGTLAEVMDHLRGGGRLSRARPTPASEEDTAGGEPDLADVRGQETARRALEIAAAGGHNVLMVGPPGAGKTMLARRMPGILPPLRLDEALEVTTVHSVAGILPPGTSLVTRRPFRSPHHTVSTAGLVGGGRPVRPGEISLAHHGVLFLDELPEFHRNVLEVLRQPLEEGRVTVVRVSETVEYPARLTLIAAMNPCPCGYHGESEGACACDPTRIARYRSRVSGPLRDRIDLHVHVPPVSIERLREDASGEPSRVVRRRVLRARRVQRERYAGVEGVRTNGDLGDGGVRRWCRLDEAAEALLRAGAQRLGLSARAVTRVLKLARTVADLARRPDVTREDVAEALHFRTAEIEVPS